MKHAFAAPAIERLTGRKWASPKAGGAWTPADRITVFANGSSCIPSIGAGESGCARGARYESAGRAGRSAAGLAACIRTQAQLESRAPAHARNVDVPSPTPHFPAHPSARPPVLRLA